MTTSVLKLQDVDPIEQLEALCSTVAVEAFSLKSVTNRVADVIPNLAHAFRQYVYAHKSDKYDLKPLDVNMTVLSKALAGANYLDIGKFAVCVPQGFKGSMVEYLAVMSQCIEFTNGIRERMLSFNQLISAILTNRNTRASTLDLSNATSKMESHRESQRKALQSFALNNSRSDRKPLQETYRNLAEITQAAQTVAALVEQARALNLQDINALIHDALELVDELESRASQGTLDNLSPQVYKSLASSTLTMARDAEFHGLMCFKTWELKDCTETTAKELIKALRY